MVIQGWASFFEEESKQEYYKKLMEFINSEYDTKTIYPIREQLFRCFELTPYDEVKVVILGQDPYHEENQAHGLCFSVNEGVAIPPSLRNIFIELQDDMRIPAAKHGNLCSWANQGVLLLNTVLSVEKGKANSHKNKGWETLTDHVLQYLNKKKQPIVFVLWGNQAKDKAKYITNKHHLILNSSHPSPLSAYRNFFGTKPFSRINDFLLQNHMTPIQWQLQEESHVSSYR